MPQVVLDLPEEFFSALRRSPDEFVSEMRLAAAIHWYVQSEMSQEKAAQIAGLSRSDFIAELGRQKIDVIHIDVEAMEDELQRGDPRMLNTQSHED